MGDIGADVDLPHVEVVADRPTREHVDEEEVRAQFVAGVAADPRVERSLVAQSPRLAPRAVEGAPPVHEQSTSHVGVGEQPRREVEHLLIPERCALVRLARETAGPDGESVAVGRGRDPVVVRREPQGGLCGQVALDADVGVRPHVAPASCRRRERPSVSSVQRPGERCHCDARRIALRVVVVAGRHRHRGRDGDGAVGHDVAGPTPGGESASLVARRDVAGAIEVLDHRAGGDDHVGVSLAGETSAEQHLALIVLCTVGLDGGEVVAVEAPHVVVDARGDGDRGGAVRGDDELLGHHMEVVEAGESSHRHERSCPLPGGPEPTVGDLAVLQAEFDLRGSTLVDPKLVPVDLDRHEQSVGNCAQLAPHAVGHVVGVGHDTTDEVGRTLVGPCAAVAEVAVADEEARPHLHAARWRRGHVDHLPPGVGVGVLAQLRCCRRHRASVAGDRERPDTGKQRWATVAAWPRSHRHRSAPLDIGRPESSSGRPPSVA